mmetsp:Transcript_99886/g.172208  ORF Transcript_99886/g.172208 Transcript_99886/m.172208 type:complete len:205 (-) Transcript_99886:608-1222(-)
MHEGTGNHDVKCQQHGALYPVGLPSPEQLSTNQHGHPKGRQEERLKDQVQVFAHAPRDEHQGRHRKQGNLQGGPDGNPHGNVHLPLHRHPHGSGVLSSVADDGQQDDRDKALREATLFRCYFQGVHKALAHDGNQDSGDRQATQRKGHGVLWFLSCFFVLIPRSIITVVKKLLVRAQLKDHEEDVHHNHDDSYLPGNGQRRFHR